MFRKAKNIDTAFRQTRVLAIGIITATILLCCYVTYKSFELSKNVQSKIYVLGNGKALEAYASERADNLPVEAKDQVKTFHSAFFTLSPDEKHNQQTINRALNLADNSAKRQYDNLRESNYYTGIITGNINQVVITDSISLQLESSPIRFRFHGKQEITRPSSVVVRSLITEGALRQVQRSENNPHGLLIERWKIIENKDLSIKNR